MPAARLVDRLLDGRQALETGRWEDARAAFEESLAEQETAAARDGLGQALWFLGRVEDGIAARELAFDRYVHDRRCDEAARVAVWISHQYFVSGRASAARGWLARAERAVERIGPCAGHGWVAVERARHAEGVEQRAEHARRALQIARDTGAADLEVFALSLLGRAEVSAGRREAGMQLLEEAMAAACAGRVHNVHTLGEAYCNLLCASTSAGEWARAAEWREHVENFAHEHACGATPLVGACGVAHADVLLATGRWAEAEQALTSVLAVHAHRSPAMGPPTVAAMAELRIRQGRLPEAKLLLEGRDVHPASLRALAQLRIAEGRPDVAAVLLERGLTAAQPDVTQTSQLFALLVDARLAYGDIERAGAAAIALDELAATSEITLVAARAELAAARVALAAGRPSEAVGPANRALAAFSRLAMPLETGEARLELARALAADAPELARDDARAALAAFQELGASRAMDAAAAVLRDLGAGTAPRARAHGELTAREHEVLGLIGLGMSNARIALTLCISEKTAGHHVSRILSKLGVRNRAEAAVHAARAQAA